jgi:hypothetical protein
MLSMPIPTRAKGQGQIQSDPARRATDVTDTRHGRMGMIGHGRWEEEEEEEGGAYIAHITW